ncbi:hypothetical protein Q1695_008371 [Nippostrongylus brasiliensis]|nr:hypothetical protein Q1695_008371 [Nippostrongylus brasiliensis]
MRLTFRVAAKSPFCFDDELDRSVSRASNHVVYSIMNRRLATGSFPANRFECSAQWRFRRQAYPPNPAPFQPRVEDYNLPPFYQPHPGRDASSLTPVFPFTSEFNNGLDVNHGTRITVDGNLNVPILGGVKVGRPNTRVGFGSLQRPTNVLGISADTLATLARDGNFNQARENVPSIPVSVLPGNFVPIRCKPPFCNPFVHNTAFGVDVEPGDDYLFDGGLDFPIPLGPSGVGVRFPLSGAVNVGTDPLLITYGHGLGPVEPPGFRSKGKRRRDD